MYMEQRVMTVIEIGQIMVPDPNWGNHWIPIPLEDSTIDHKYSGMEAIVIGRIGFDKFLLQFLNSETKLIGCIDYNEYDIDIPNPQEEMILKKEEKKPFTTKKRCEFCNEDYPDDFQYCEKCGEELTIEPEKSNLLDFYKNEPIPKTKMKWDKRMYQLESKEKQHSYISDEEEEKIWDVHYKRPTDMNNDGKIGNIFSSIPKSEVPLYKKRWG